MKKTLFLGLALLLSMLAVRAQDRPRGPDRDDRRERSRVIVYQDADYRGDYLVLFPGDRLENLATLRFANGARLNDAISSVRVEGRAEIYLYTDARFRGSVLRLIGDVRDLTRLKLPDNRVISWNDRASALRVGERPPGDRWVDPDEIIRRAYRELLVRDPDRAGWDNYRALIVEQGWSEDMVRDNIRDGAEFRNEGTRRIILAAFQDVFGREPRGDEMARYRRKIIEENWLGPEIRAELKRTDEYRRRPPGGPPR